ncbi:MAG TPA: RNA 2',3'-cyclic phosphodiesterase, partial [Syntrophales bacterium]|nr:RNA 2',3'-cyclic phosphodiesterase [Syntrophales bacterium]
MNSEKSVRAFLAIEPPAEILKEIGKIQSRLKEACPFDIRWVKPEAMHLTLKFFGNVSEEEIIAISRVVEKHTAAFAPLQLEVKKLGLFPSLRRPKVLWIGLEGDITSLLVLHNKLEQGFEECGFAKEERSFRPHLTLGRIKIPKCSGNPEHFLRDGG